MFCDFYSCNAVSWGGVAPPPKPPRRPCVSIRDWLQYYVHRSRYEFLAPSRGRVTIDWVNQLTQSIELIESNSLASICDRKRNLCQIFVFEADLSQRLSRLGHTWTISVIAILCARFGRTGLKSAAEYSGQLSADRFNGLPSPVRYGGRRT